MPPPRSSNAPRSYSTAHVARQLGISIPTVQRWVDAGRLAAWKTPGGHRRIEADSADQLFAEHRGSALDGKPAPTVVLVEDNPDDADLIRTMLDHLLPGCRIQTFDRAVPALVAIGHEAPDLLISDVVMPDMDGLDMLRQLAGHCVVQPKKIVVVSSLADRHIARLGGLPAGVPLVRKPVGLAQLRDALGLGQTPSGTT